DHAGWLHEQQNRRFDVRVPRRDRRQPGDGVTIAGSGNLVQGDYIGLDANGNGGPGLGNLLSGVAIAEGASRNTIGGPTPGFRVVIAGNRGDGVAIAGSDNLVQGVYIGLDPLGQMPLGNAGSGVAILDGASGNLVVASVISGNQGNGVTI